MISRVFQLQTVSGKKESFQLVFIVTKTQNLSSHYLERKQLTTFHVYCLKH